MPLQTCHCGLGETACLNILYRHLSIPLSPWDSGKHHGDGEGSPGKLERQMEHEMQSQGMKGLSMRGRQLDRLLTEHLARIRHPWIHVQQNSQRERRIKRAR